MAATAISLRFSITSRTKAEYNKSSRSIREIWAWIPNVAGTPKQRPFAAVLGCSDARVPIELIFNEGPNDLFVVRVAGNGLGLEVLGSLKYAVDHLGGTLKLIVVLGHSGCGALTAAVDVFLNPGDYVTIAAKHSIRNILDRSLIVVQASANKLLSAFGPGVTRNPGYRQALIEASIVTNAALSAYSIQQEFVSHDLPELQAVYGVYVLETREVWAPRSGSIKGTGLAAAPRDLAGFAAFCRRSCSIGANCLLSEIRDI